MTILLLSSINNEGENDVMYINLKKLCSFWLGCTILAGCNPVQASPTSDAAQFKESYTLVTDPETGVRDDYRSIPELQRLLPLDIKEASDMLYEDRREIECLAWNLYFEIRGGKTNEQIAIAYVPINRIGKSEFASSVCANVFQYHMVNGKIKHQFSWVGRKFGKSFKIEPDSWQKMQQLAIQVWNKKLKDTGRGSTYFHSVNVGPQWANNTIKFTLGSHIFWKEVK